MRRSISLLIFLSLSGCSVHESSHMNSGRCDVDAHTEFGKKVLNEARRVSGNKHIRVFTDCHELNDLNSGKTKKLTSWGYELLVEDAQKIPQEQLQLHLDHVVC